jgi:peptidoglycan/LPS O-acetylase OafA/YrhL
MRESGGRIPSLDGLRAISILLVLCGHSFATLPRSWPDLGFLGVVLGNSVLGVNVFFVLSGYLITRLLMNELTTTNKISLKSFYLRRSLRIFPVFYTYLLIMAALAWLGAVQIKPSQFAAAGTFLWNYKHVLGIGGDQGDWYLGHFWSLAIEEQFYLLWPATLALLGCRRAFYFGIATLAALPFIRIATYLLWPASRPQISIMFHTAADPIIFGCLLALAPQVLPKWTKPPWFTGKLVCLSAVYLLLVSPWLRLLLRGYYYATIGPLIESSAICACLTWLITNPTTPAGRLLNSRPFIYIGQLSYSLYIWNQPFLATLNTTLTGLFPLNLICNFLAAWLSQQLLERPLARRRANLRPAAPPASRNILPEPTL